MQTLANRIKNQSQRVEDALLSLRDGKTVEFYKQLTEVHNQFVTLRDLIDLNVRKEKENN